MIPATVRIFVCAEPQDMRRSFDGLALAAQEHLGEDPQRGAVFVFCNKRRDRLKALWFDANGYCILYKRLHRAHFELPELRTIEPGMLAKILRGVDSGRRRSLRD
jgi:transposase